MNFYEVGLSDRALKQHQSLTYSSVDELSRGDMVRVSIRNRQKNGVVLGSVSKPKYDTKPIEGVLRSAAIPSHLIDLAVWVANYYAVDLGTSLGLVIPKGAEKKRRVTQAQPSKVSPSKQSGKLTEEQSLALKAITNNAETFILHGETGSGKSRIYIELAKTARQEANGSIVLVPEIGLTSGMIDEFTSQLGEDELFIVHSKQTEAERHAQWEQIRNAKAPIVIGPRSALFSPIENLGLIVVDEEHETSYKQDISPKYHAVRVASMLRKLTNVTLVLGSATPSVEDYQLAKKSQIVRMEKPISTLHKTDIQTIDIKNRDMFTRDKWLATPLLDAISKAIDSNKQAMIFHNRRGTSTSVICESCGFVANCPNCELPLTHHADWAKLVCHICDHRQAVLSSCPDCGSTELVYRGAGTKEITASLAKQFPSAVVERFDSDVSSQADRLEQRYNALIDGEVDVIVGTQMVAKGLDLPNLQVVGVINADISLYLPDYTSSERSYQLIRQVIGRAGRHQDGQVFLQTYNPDSPTLSLATGKDWDGFYKTELLSRKLAGYPPYKNLLKLTFEARNSNSAHESAVKLAKALQKGVQNIEVLGPSPSFHHKSRSGWRWQLVVKAENRSKLVNIARQLPAGWQFELDPINLL